MILLSLGLMLLLYFVQAEGSRSEIPYPLFERQLKLESPNILRLEVGDGQAMGVFRDPPEVEDEFDDSGKLVSQVDKQKNERRRYNKKFYVNLPRNDTSRDKLLGLLRESKIDYRLETPGSSSLEIFWLLVIGLFLASLIFFWTQLRRTRDQMMGGGFLTGFSKSPAKRYEAA